MLGARGRDSALPLLKELHWLPVVEGINFKIALTTFKLLCFNQPAYLRDLLSVYTPARSLRSFSQLSLVVPLAKSTLCSQSFEVFAPCCGTCSPSILETLSGTKFL